MNLEEQRVAIAQALGCKYIQMETLEWADLGGGGETTDLIGRFPGSPIREQIPNYPHDLNAMHEAEQVLTTEGELQDYVVHLTAVVTEGRYSPGEAEPWATCHATAAQRAEAFLKTLNLWTE